MKTEFGALLLLESDLSGSSLEQPLADDKCSKTILQMSGPTGNAPSTVTPGTGPRPRGVRTLCSSFRVPVAPTGVPGPEGTLIKSLWVATGP